MTEGCQRQWWGVTRRGSRHFLPEDAGKFNLLHSHPKPWPSQVEGVCSLEGLVASAWDKEQEQRAILLSKLRDSSQELVLLAGAAHRAHGTAGHQHRSCRDTGSCGDFLATEAWCLCRPLLLCLRARVTPCWEREMGKTEKLSTRPQRLLCSFVFYTFGEQKTLFF